MNQSAGEQGHPGRSVMVVGAGIMGAEIAWVVAGAGWNVAVMDQDPAALGRASAHLEDLGRRRVARGRMDEDTEAAIRARVAWTTKLTAMDRCAIVIEAVTERLKVKRAVFAALDAAVPPEAILASNTSGISITALAVATHRPDRVLGLHFFNPAATMRLVEVVRGRRSSERTMEMGERFVRSLGKTPITVRECPGFLVNRILVRATVEAYRAAASLHADPAGVDAALTETGLVPMGPFALGDLIGLDTLAYLRRDLEGAYGERFRDGGTLDHRVAAGQIGLKSGHGFIDPRQEPREPGDAERTASAAYLRGARAEARLCLSEDVAAESDVALAMHLGCGWSPLLLELQDPDGPADGRYPTLGGAGVADATDG